MDNTIPKISEQHKNMCEEDITIKELGEALKKLKNGKSRVSDGFTPDFYKFFWPNIKETFFESIKYADNDGKLSIDQR